GLDLSKVSEESLRKRITDLQRAHDEAVASIAVNDADMKYLQSMAGSLQEATTIRDKCRKDMDDAKKELDKIRAAEPEILSYDDQPCPECGAALSVRGGKIEKGGSVTKKQAEKSRKEHERWQAKVEEARVISDKESEIYRKNLALYEECVEAKKKLDELGKRTPPKNNRTKQAIDADMDVAALTLDSFQQYHKARELHNRIILNEAIVKALSPEGIRKQALNRGLDVLKNGVNSFCKAAHWGDIDIDSDMNIYYNGMAYYFCSESERFRIRVAFQLWIALQDGSDLVVIDRADILDRAGRQGLFAALVAFGIPALVCMTLNTQDDMPKADILASFDAAAYWIEEGEIVTEAVTA
ncbi:MAG: hypothetical protein J7M24_00595, partial [Candidatus Latescibacteria bacterium]|nr:hypothetical protein [Candidatus Latescibacterota bacterium]